jgi:hypothetical protein
VPESYDQAKRQLFAKIEKETMLKACEIEMQLVGKAKEVVRLLSTALGVDLKTW